MASRGNLTIRVNPETRDRLRLLANATGRSIGAVVDLFSLSATPEDLAIFCLRRARLSPEPALPFPRTRQQGKESDP